MTGRRPKRSDKPPMMGEKINSITEYENDSQPAYWAASLRLPPVSCLMSNGTTGMMIPIPITSIKMVMNTKIIAGLRL